MRRLGPWLLSALLSAGGFVAPAWGMSPPIPGPEQTLAAAGVRIPRKLLRFMMGSSRSICAEGCSSTRHWRLMKRMGH